MTTDLDPRAQLDEIKARAIQHGKAMNSLGYQTPPTCLDDVEVATALVAVLDIEPSTIEIGGEEDPEFTTGYNSGYEDALADIRAAITEKLGGDRE